MKFLTKKTLFFIFLGSLITATSLSLTWVCGAPNFLHHTKCIRLFDSLVISIVFDVATFLVLAILPSLFTLPFPSRVFEAWRNFALWAAPITAALMILPIFLGGSSAGIGGAIGAGYVTLFWLGLYGLYVLISLGTIGWAVFQGKKAS